MSFAQGLGRLLNRPPRLMPVNSPRGTRTLIPLALRALVILEKSGEATAAELFTALISYQDTRPSEVLDALKTLSELGLIEPSSISQGGFNYFTLAGEGRKLVKQLGNNPSLLAHKIDLV